MSVENHYAPVGKSYRCGFNVVAAGAGVAATISGGSGKTIEVTQIIFAKPSADVNLEVKRYGSAISDGTSSAPTITPFDSTNEAATGVVTSFTGVPTEPTSSNDLGHIFALAGVLTTEVVYLDMMRRGVSGVILRGSAESIGIKVSATATVRVTIEWIERDA